jgi:hypothetical protein
VNGNVVLAHDYGLNVESCLLLPVWLVGPFICLAAFAYYLLISDPMPIRLFVVLSLPIVLCFWMLWPFHLPETLSSLQAIWLIAAVASILLFPVVGLRESGKRGWLPFLAIRRRKLGKKSRARRKQETDH